MTNLQHGVMTQHHDHGSNGSNAFLDPTVRLAGMALWYYGTRDVIDEGLRSIRFAGRVA